MAQDTKTVAVYCRFSKDPMRLEVGVDRQRADCLELARRLWPEALVRCFVDNDVSAADPSARRPAWQAMLDGLRAGDLDELVAYDQSRLTRQPVEWEQLLVVLARRGIGSVHTVREGERNIGEGGGRMVSRIMAAVDAEYAEVTRIRVRRAMRQLAAEGRPNGGRLFGYVSAVGPDVRYRTTRKRRPSRRHLLSAGLAQCGVCGAPLSAQLKRRASGKLFTSYICDPRVGQVCVGIVGHYLERHVTETLLGALRDPEVASALGGRERAETPALGLELDAVEADLAGLAGSWGRAEITRGEWQAAREPLVRRAQNLRDRIVVRPLAAYGEVTDLAERWDDMGLVGRRALVAALFERVEVYRATTTLYDPTRIVLVWRVGPRSAPGQLLSQDQRARGGRRSRSRTASSAHQRVIEAPVEFTNERRPAGLHHGQPNDGRQRCVEAPLEALPGDDEVSEIHGRVIRPASDIGNSACCPDRTAAGNPPWRTACGDTGQR